jgi:hypothetical protein
VETRTDIHRTACASLAVLGLVLAGCGSSNTATSTSTLPKVPGVTPYTPPPPAKQISYSVSLGSAKGVPVGAPAGAPNASGLVAISINPATRELCWRFTELKNVPKPTAARLYQYVPGGTGEGGLPLGRTYTPSGCLVRNVTVYAVLEAHPERFYVSLHSAKFPAGAVRGQL